MLTQCSGGKGARVIKVGRFYLSVWTLTTETACWVNKNIGDMRSSYTEAIFALSKNKGMSNIEQLFVHYKSHTQLIGIWVKSPSAHKKRNALP